MLIVLVVKLIGKTLVEHVNFLVICDMYEKWCFLFPYMYSFVNLNPLMWAYMSCFHFRNKKNSRNQILNILAETELRLKIGEDTETNGRILEESWRKSMEDVNSWISWWVSMGFGRSWRKEARRKSFGHLQEFPDFGRLDLLSLIGFYRNVEGWIGRSGLHETCRWLKILEFNIRLA